MSEEEMKAVPTGLPLEGTIPPYAGPPTITFLRVDDRTKELMRFSIVDGKLEMALLTSNFPEMSKSEYANALARSMYQVVMNCVDGSKMAPEKPHRCEVITTHDVYGGAIESCGDWYNDGKLWAGNGEYESQVAFCPYCGYEAKVKPEIESISGTQPKVPKEISEDMADTVCKGGMLKGEKIIVSFGSEDKTKTDIFHIDGSGNTTYNYPVYLCENCGNKTVSVLFMYHHNGKDYKKYCPDCAAKLLEPLPQLKETGEFGTYKTPAGQVADDK